MVMRKQRANGAWENPIDLLATDPLTTLAYFDQPTRSTLDTPISPFTMKDQLAFRSNAFPVAAFTPMAVRPS